jgi:hypothetical protein
MDWNHGPDVPQEMVREDIKDKVSGLGFRVGTTEFKKSA